MVGLESTKAVLGLRENILWAQVDSFWFARHRVAHLGGKNDVVAITLDATPDYLLRAAVDVDVGRVDEIDSRVLGLPKDLGRLLLAQLAAEVVSP